MSRCRLCGGALQEFVDFGRHPMADAFLLPVSFDDEFFYQLAVGMCETCTMVQLKDEVPNERMFHKEYPYRSSGSRVMREHFEKSAQTFLNNELSGTDPLIVELGSNDGVLLDAIARAGVRHLGVEPCGDLAEVARAKGINVLSKYFNAPTGREIAATHGRADVVFAANTFSHISYLNSVFHGVEALLAQDGSFVFEDPYFPDIIDNTSFDQMYDEHVYFFTACSVQAAATRCGFELVDVERLPVHGGEVRYTVTRPGVRTPTAAVEELLDEESARDLTETATLERFAVNVGRIRDDLVRLLRDLNARGKRVVGYGATAKSSTLLNFGGIGPDLIPFICDSTPAKQGLFTPGSHIPVRGPEAFREPYPDYAVLFAWNHAEEIMSNEREFREAGGRWILYVPEVQVV